MEFRNFQYHMPTRVVFGPGCLNTLPEVVAEFGKRALIISYNDSPWAVSTYQQLAALLEQGGIEVVGFGQVEPEPDPATIDRVAQEFSGSTVDVVIGAGGGSVLDAAKGIAVVLSLGGAAWDYVGRGKVTVPVKPVIAIPSTAGTGSEVTPYAIFKNAALNRKAGIISPMIFPKVAFLDPEFIASLPPHVTAVSGIDAFAHALEAYTSPTRTPMASAVAYQALELIGKSLSTAIENGADLDARSAMLIGSTLAGIAIAHAGTGIAHAIGATLGGFYPVEHGWLVGLVLPEAVRYNTPVAKDLYYQVAQAIGLPVEGLTPEQASERLAEQVTDWLTLANLKCNLRSLGVQRERFPDMIADTSTQNSVGNNIRPVDRVEIEAFYERLF